MDGTIFSGISGESLVWRFGAAYIGLGVSRILMGIEIID